MVNILGKKDFYRMMLRDRMPVVQTKFPLKSGAGKVEFFNTPLGTVLRTELDGGSQFKEIKLYDKGRGRFVYQNTFCSDEIIEIEKGIFLSVSGKLQIEDIIGREFLIKIDDLNIISRAEMLPPRSRVVDKRANLVYN